MSRLQLALNVDDIDTAVEFYSTLFDTPPAKRRPGYANFAVENPALKLVLIENPEQTGTLNHLGVERDSMAEVQAEADRLEAAGLALRSEGDVVCCYARQDKHWVTGPDTQRWENYVVLADAPRARGPDPERPGRPVSTGGCCGTPAAETDANSDAQLQPATADAARC